jgi:hypothetical protein
MDRVVSYRMYSRPVVGGATASMDVIVQVMSIYRLLKVNGDPFEAPGVWVICRSQEPIAVPSTAFT